MSESTSSSPPDEMAVSDLKPAPLPPRYTYKNPLLCSRFTQTALYAYLVLALLGSALTALQFTILFLDNKGTVTPEILWEINAQGWTYLGNITLTVFIVTAIIFARWIHRAASNAHALDPGGLPDSPRMCIGWHFVPFANLVKPYQSMRDINAISSSHGRYSAARLLPWWWGLWLLTGWVERIFESVWATAETNEEIMNVSAFYQITYLGECALTILAIIIVRRITNAQRCHHDPAPAQPELIPTQTPLSS